MNKELKQIINQDLSRTYSLPLSLKERILLPLERKYIILWRKASFYQNKNRFLYRFYAWRLQRLTNQTHINIPIGTKIGAGLYIGHLGRIIINPDVILGNNINLATGITIGQTNRGSKKGVPTIGNQVWIGTNAVIVGNIKIGDNVLIAPNSYVNTDVPSDSIVIGNPAVIHPNSDATKDYINHMV